MTESNVSFLLNGKTVTIEAHPLKRLIDVLRNDLSCTGTKEGCGEGECGACSVFIDGKLINSCLVPVAQVENSRIETIESVHGSQGLHHLQQAFLETGGAQCGICTPGMILACLDLLSHNANPSEQDVRHAIAGNLCRCTGYNKIIDAVLLAAQRCREQAGVQR